jgi:hypothetical protein
VTQPNPQGTVDPEDRRKHLDYIQAHVIRMSTASSTAKGWLLPVVTAAYGFSVSAKEGSIALLGVAAVLLFGFLDANYLRQERAFRRLYDAVARQTRAVPLFSLNTAEADDPIPAATDTWGKVKTAVHRWFPGRTVWLSWSIAPFYGPFVVIGCVIAIVAL